MVKGSQGITTIAKNKNAKYKLVTSKGQTITGNDKRIYTKYTYSRLITSLLYKKYSYAV